MKKPTTTRTELRITDQRRLRDARGYDLACEGGKLKLQVAQIEDGSDASWRVEAKGRAYADGEEACALETGSTPTEALRAVAKSWREKEPLHGIRMFDWEAVEALLVGVRAL